MGLSIAIVRPTAEMYGEIDQRFSPMGVTCTSVSPHAFQDFSYFQQQPHDVLFVPLSCLDVDPTSEWMNAIEQAARSVKTRVVWLMSPSQRAVHRTSVETILLVEEIQRYIDQLRVQFGMLSADSPAAPSAPTAATSEKNGSASSILNRFRKWVEAEVADPAQASSGASEHSGHSDPGATQFSATQMPSSRPKGSTGSVVLTPDDSDWNGGTFAGQAMSRPSTTSEPNRPKTPPAPRKSSMEEISDPNDIQLLREYIRYKEEEVGDLKTQLSMFEAETQKQLKQIEFLKNEKVVQERKVDTLRGRVLFLEEEVEKLRKQKAQELDSLRAEYKNKIERLSIAENTLREQELKFDDLRERVRRDLFSVQERERYLEARMEILKRDTEILLHHKDEKIVELKELIKQLEFKNEAYQEALTRYKELDREDQDRAKRIVRALKLATSLLDQEETTPKDGDIRKREA